MLLDDARQMLDRLVAAGAIEPGADAAFAIAASPEDGIEFALAISLTISLKRLADGIAALERAVDRAAVVAEGR